MVSIQVPSTPKTQAPVSPKAGAYLLEGSASAHPADLPSTAPRAGNYDVWARVSMPDKRQLKGGLTMRVLLACAIIITTAVGLAGCFHHQQATYAEPIARPPLK